MTNNFWLVLLMGGLILYGFALRHTTDPREFTTPCYGAAQCAQMGIRTQ